MRKRALRAARAPSLTFFPLLLHVVPSSREASLQGEGIVDAHVPPSHHPTRRVLPLANVEVAVLIAKEAAVGVAPEDVVKEARVNPWKQPLLQVLGPVIATVQESVLFPAVPVHINEQEDAAGLLGCRQKLTHGVNRGVEYGRWRSVAPLCFDFFIRAWDEQSRRMRRQRIKVPRKSNIA